MKNKALASQFPNIYRIITESPFVKNFEKSMFRLILQSKLKKPATIFAAISVFVIVVILAFWIAIFSIRIYRYYTYVQSISIQRQAIQAKINFWQSVAQKYDGYKDAYFQIATLEYQLGDFNKAKENNQKALLLDPNFEDAKKLEAILDKK